MTRKRFQKLLMSRGLSCKKARRIVETMKSTYLAMNAHTAYIYDYAQDDRYWYDNGNPRGTGNWTDGEYHGKREMYSEDGNEKIVQEYKNGILVEE